MNKISRLTALLLALTVIFSSLVTAESAIQIGGATGMTGDAWSALVQSAEDKLFTINEGDSGKTITPAAPEQPADWFRPHTDGASAQLGDAAVSLDITASGVAALTNAQSGQWQIRIGEGWYDVAGENGNTIYVTGAMLGGMTAGDFRKGIGEKDAVTGEYPSYTATATVNIVEALPQLLFSAARSAEGDAAQASTEEDFSPFSLERANAGLEKHLITINYIFKSNQQVAAAPYYAEVSTNKETFSADVKHPVIKGYAPEYATLLEINAAGTVVSESTTLPAGFTYGADGITIDKAPIAGDVSINVYFAPAENKFTVKYWEEKAVYTTDPATGEEIRYDPVKSIEYTGYTEAPVKNSYPAANADTAQYFATQHSHEGFKPLMYDENITIAADGSTVVNIYYQRNYYLMVFQLEGGYGTNPVYTRYEAPVGTVADPRRPGYAFMGWTDTKQGTNLVEVPDTMPLGSKTYYAVWEPQQVEYTVAYWLENPNWVDATPNDATDNAGQYDFVGYETIENVLAGSMTEVQDNPAMPDAFISDSDGNVDVHLKRNISWLRSDPNTEVAGDGSTIINVYYERKDFKLRFYYAMSTVLEDTTTQYKVVGGTTYYFGSWGGYSNDEFTLLRRYSMGWGYNVTDNTGVVDEVPVLKSDVASRYTSGSVNPENDNDPYTYYFIEFTADYGADISKLWPVDVFESVSTTVNAENWGGTRAFVAGWNGEHCVHYSRANDNETIKGSYNQLDYQLLWQYSLENRYGDGTNNNEVAFLCFWENGANIGWSIPELYRYHIYVEALPGEAESDTDVVYNNKRYVRRTVYDTVDDSAPNQQTDPAIVGLKSLAQHNASDNNKLIVDTYDSVQVQTVVTENVDGVAVKKYRRADVSSFTSKFKTIADEVAKLEIYYDANGDGELTEDEPLYNDAYFMYFYYDRQKFTLTKSNQGQLDEGAVLMYEQSLAGLGEKPVYPGAAELAAGFTFDGWYTSATFDTDTKVDFDTATMPANDVILYAHWKPITHSVFVYNTMSEALRARDGLHKDPNTRPPADVEYLYYWLDKVAHGQPTSSAYTYDNDEWYDKENQSFKDPEREGFNFTLWFYLDENGEAQPFSFNATPITQDTIVFAGWTAEAYADYKIYYVMDDGQTGAVAQSWYTDPANWVADPKEGSNLAGAYVTEDAKGGIQLKEEFQSGWFPTLESHSFFLEEIAVDKNTYVFEYVSRDAVPYTVHYVTVEKPATGTITEVVIDGKTYYKLADSKTVTDNKKAVVTENYKTIPGSYVPDAFQKRLVLSADGADNEIVFVYTRDPKRTTVEVNHYKVHAGTAVKDAELYDTSKQIVELPYTEEFEAISIPNYTFDPARTTRYVGGVEEAGNTSLAVDLKEESEGVVLELYYLENTVDISYLAVGPEGCDSNDVPLETSAGTVDRAKEEKLGVVTGEPRGSNAEAAEGYHFVGWYKNAECTELLSHEELCTPETVDGIYVEATYYALFEENVVDVSYVAVFRDLKGVLHAENVTGGTVDVPDNDTPAGAKDAESLLAITDCTASGAAAAPAEYHKLAGWYTDAACTTAVDAAWVTDGTILPRKAESDIWPEEGVTYYALFERQIAGLKITKDGLQNTNESVIVDVVVITDGVRKDYTIALSGAKNSATIVNIPVGSTYTVTERTSWSWLYTETSKAGQSGAIVSTGNEVKITNAKKTDKWLHDEGYAVNDFESGKKDDTYNQ